jgi:hypothetical protein
MSNKSEISWFSREVLQINVEYSRTIYSLLEQDLSSCTQCVALDLLNLSVFSNRFADLILRIGPEILRVFNLILFNNRRADSFQIEPKLKEAIFGLQTRKEQKRDGFDDYLKATCLARADTLKMIKVPVKALGKFLLPFETEKRMKNEKPFDILPWWEDGYNALKHRVIEEFKTSATLKHALFSLAGLWSLHYILDYDWGREGLLKSAFFEQPTASLPDRIYSEQLK